FHLNGLEAPTFCQASRSQTGLVSQRFLQDSVRQPKSHVLATIEAVPMMFEKIWDAHVVREEPGEPALLYVDLHLIHEVTSPQAFEGLRLAGRGVRRPDRSLATMDHNVPTDDGPVRDPVARAQLEALRQNCEEFGIPLF